MKSTMLNLLRGTLLLGASAAAFAAQSAKVTTLRAPDGGIQPVAALDDKGAVHLIYYKGDAQGGDVFYAKSTDGAAFSAPLKVNTNDSSAVAAGNIRGAHLAVGKNGRAHVAWMGSGKSSPKAPGDASPMLYTRLNDSGAAFEPERNIIQFATGLDGGGSVAADRNGNVYVAWHGGGHGKGEASRQVFVARSTDDGKTFSREAPATAAPTGACGCCGMRAFAGASGNVYMLYRGASGGGGKPDVRDMFLLVSKDKGATFQGSDIHPWKVNMCMMSSAAFSEGKDAVLAAWETQSQVYFARLNPTTGQPSPPVSAPGAGKRKHPAVAANAAGETLLVWTDGMAWQKGGSVEWQVFDKSGRPTAENGQARGVPPNSLVTAFAKPDGSFVVVY